jgi:hypothetical protein
LNEPRPISVQPALILRAMRSVATLSGRSIPVPVERELLRLVQQHVLRSDLDLDTLPAIAPGELRAALPDPDQRAWVVRCATLVPYVSLEVDQAKIAAVDAFAMQLGTVPEVLDDLHRRRRVQLERVVLDQARRGVRIYLTVRTSAQLRGVVEALHRQHPDPALAARFRELDALPLTSLGGALRDFYRSRGMALPGEPGCLDERLLEHDLLHVLGGFGADLADETALVGFAAGVARLPMGRQILLDAIVECCCIAQLVGMLAPGASRPALDVAAIAAAHDRGVVVRSDRLRTWDWWGDVRTELATLRERFAIRVPGRVQPLPATAPARAKEPRAA